MDFTFLIFIVLIPQLVNCLNPSPCPEIFDYESKVENDRWYGVISLRSSEDLTGVYLNILLDRPAQLLGVSKEFSLISKAPLTTFKCLGIGGKT